MSRKPHKHKVIAITAIETNALLEQEMRQLKEQVGVIPPDEEQTTLLFPFAVLALVAGKKTEIDYLVVATGTQPGDFQFNVKLGYPDKRPLDDLQGWRTACLQQVHDAVLALIDQSTEPAIAPPTAAEPQQS